jgi:hypothetical protein
MHRMTFRGVIAGTECRLDDDNGESLS